MKNLFSGRKNRDMTQGPILRDLLLYALPLIGGNIFQMLYSTVDSIVVGNYVSTEAYAAIGATGPITNILIYLFSGFSTGATVVIGRLFGAKDPEKVHDAIETTIALTFLFCILFTVIGIAFTGPMLRLTSTPEDVFPEAATYLKVYFAGISGMLVFNMVSGILRAVGDSVRPLLFLTLCSILNTMLDLLFVRVIPLGIAGVAVATVISEFVSAAALLVLLSRTTESYRLTWHDLRVDRGLTKEIMDIGLPAGFQSIITAVSNTFVQGYINVFGKAVIAGWNTFNKLADLVAFPLNSLSQSVVTFVSQNMGARKYERTRDAIRLTNRITVGLTALLCTVVFVFAGPSARIFNDDPAVLEYAVLFTKVNIYSYVIGSLSHILSGVLRGLGDSRNVMFLKVGFFVVLRQLYLFVVTRYVSNTPVPVSLSMSLCWILGSLAELLYYRVRWSKKLIEMEEKE